MNTITRGTTPPIIVELPEGMTTTDVAELWVTVTQRGELFTKELDDMTPAADGKSFEVTLTQEETLKLSACVGMLRVQARLRTALGKAIASDALTVDVGEILKDGVI